MKTKIGQSVSQSTVSLRIQLAFSNVGLAVLVFFREPKQEKPRWQWWQSFSTCPWRANDVGLKPSLSGQSRFSQSKKNLTFVVRNRGVRAGVLVESRESKESRKCLVTPTVADFSNPFRLLFKRMRHSSNWLLCAPYRVCSNFVLMGIQRFSLSQSAREP